MGERWGIMRKAVARAGVAAALVVAAASCGGGGGSGDDGEAERRADDDAGNTEPAAVPSAGCEGRATEQSDLAEATMDVRGTPRRFLLSAPAWNEGDEPRPLVVDFHGLAEGATVHAEMTQLGPLGVAEGFVTVFPEALGSPVAWNVTPDLERNDDLALVAAVLDRVEAEQCIDTGRVYATGLSNGAMMTSTVACTMADRFAAVAPIAGVTMPEPCEPARPVPMLSIHGTADPILLFNGGIDAGALNSALGGEDVTVTTVAADLDGEGYPATMRGWAGLDGCGDEPADERVSDEVIRRTYDCPDEAPVVFLIVEGGGHTWPSSEFSRSIERIVGRTTFDIDASQEVWEFVREFRLPG